MDVAHHEIDRGPVIVEESQRSHTVPGLEHGVAVEPQRLPDHRPHLDIVVHQQHRLGAPRRRPDENPRLAGFAVGLDPGQEHLERGAFPGLAVDLDVPPTLLGDPVDHGQAQARPLAPLLGGEERLEDPRLGVRVHSAPGVAHGQHDVGSRRHADVVARS